ncbi:hypothetical protein BKP37_08615 [Anaerobacillus alkalilacustris]|uniref:Putative aromatic acid exporter C-terminal domain-containing protein n=2 Tax=Anaerobacillus alkalilacustris TaxID=393763 RepID=A0A1S2LPM6_9BACI|nr:hypothetical protein BKP37_08615 [Anaerobacillus alkalilacustris]
MKYKIGFRTIKTAAAVSIAITIGQYFDLQFYVFSAIITILCVQTSKKKSLESASARFMACMLAIPFTYVFFEGISFSPPVIGLLLLFFIPTTVFLKINEGVVTSTVIILHIYLTGQVSWSIVLNEIALVLIGVGSALLVNLYMPNLERELQKKQEEVETNIQHIISEIAEYLRTNQKLWTEQEITDSVKGIREAKSLAYRNLENQLSKKDDYYYRYFTIREKQMEILERLILNMEHIHPMVEQRYLIADFIEFVSSYFHSNTDKTICLKKLKRVEEDFKKVPLPETWETFEARAHLLLIVRELEYYLSITTKMNASRKKMAYN